LALKDAGISILLSEQNVKSALKLIDRVYVIDNGCIRYEGTAADFDQNLEIKRKYLMA
jgi:branched-chain amino acid transport system ATP-binding protein